MRFTKIFDRLRLERRIEHFIKELFMTYRLEEVKLPLAWLTKQLGDQTDVLDVRAYLQDKRDMTPASMPMRNRIPIDLNIGRLDEQGRHEVVYHTEGVGRPYTFNAADWLKEAELAEFRLLPEAAPSPSLS
jgi:hypothetical protein